MIPGEKITNEPWSSTQRSKKERPHSPRVEGEVQLKKIIKAQENLDRADIVRDVRITPAGSDGRVSFIDATQLAN